MYRRQHSIKINISRKWCFMLSLCLRHVWIKNNTMVMFSVHKKYELQKWTETKVSLSQIIYRHLCACWFCSFFWQKYPVWKWCCHEEIPQNELIEYLEKYDNPKDPDKWQNIYDNWFSWQNIDNCIDFDVIPGATEIPRITCIAVSGTYS